MRKCVLAGNPVVSLDNMSVFVKKERQEKIAKKRVRYLNGFLLDTLVVAVQTLGMQMLTKPISKFIWNRRLSASVQSAGSYIYV